MKNRQQNHSNNNNLEWMNKNNKKQITYQNIHDKKLEKSLIGKNKHNQPNSEGNCHINKTLDTSNVINVSNYNLTQDQKFLLSKGLKFIPTPQQINVILLITNTESALSPTPITIKINVETSDLNPRVMCTSKSELDR
ncbi:unnamed protein product [Rotaria sp. Silwood2]|nr:unnamed protein product [Rotaria sp. Silwood2]CAF3430137.1 unnamed protein product [Rotaria sp. Silwood2]CAF3455598.1 unnamed protein product [Rotaria sp. Silwood2]CAF4271053.1 unnamed protein product [Rotaria sp. Silwood2]CAF4560688.1 unnamed protein product [Rotaria sp. Silwood2]